ncbi:unnamed protein product [Musa textilis]
MALGFWQQDKINSNKMMMSTYLVMFSFTSSLGYHPEEESTLFLALRLRGGMQVFGKTLTGRTVTIEVESSDTVADSKATIHHKDHVSHPDHFRLGYGVKQLEDGKSLADYNVFKESTLLHLLRRLGGGTPNQCNR